MSQRVVFQGLGLLTLVVLLVFYWNASRLSFPSEPRDVGSPVPEQTFEVKTDGNPLQVRLGPNLSHPIVEKGDEADGHGVREHHDATNSIQVGRPASSDDSSQHSSTEPLVVSKFAAGPRFVVDEHGYVCERNQMVTEPYMNGQCKGTEETGLDVFSCSGCDNNEQHKEICCSVYEFCVACCLGHFNSASFENALALPSSQGLRGKVKFPGVDSGFDTCRAICRTSSSSVVHENQYRNSNQKYCFPGQLEGET